MKTHYMYWVASEHAIDGYQIMTEADQIGIPSGWNFIQEVELPEIDTSEVVKANVKALDNSILDKKKEIQGLKEKKAQLLALPCGGAE